MTPTIKFNETRPFGLEWEFVAPIDHTIRSMPSLPHRERCAEAINALPGQRARVEDYGHNRNNTVWACKPDGTCGCEVASPVLSGYKDLRAAGDVLIALKRDARMTLSHKCGMHVHIGIKSDRPRINTLNRVKIIAAWWIKFEHLALHSVPSHRRNNEFCQSYEARLHQSNTRVMPDLAPNLDKIFAVMSNDRRRTLNLRLWDDAAPRIEFRFADMTFDPEEMKNRVRFLLWFVKVASAMPAPPNLNWVSPKQAVRFLGLIETKRKLLSPALNSMKRWLLLALSSFSDDRRNIEMANNELNGEG